MRALVYNHAKDLGQISAFTIVLIKLAERASDQGRVAKMRVQTDESSTSHRSAVAREVQFLARAMTCRDR